jgi:hypothetical protein
MALPWTRAKRRCTKGESINQDKWGERDASG